VQVYIFCGPGTTSVLKALLPNTVLQVTENKCMRQQCYDMQKH